MNSFFRRLRGGRKKKEKVSSSFIGSSGTTGTADSSNTSVQHGNQRKPLQLQDDDERTHPIQEQSPSADELDNHHKRNSNHLGASPKGHRRKNSGEALKLHMPHLFSKRQPNATRSNKTAPGHTQAEVVIGEGGGKLSSATLKRRSRLAAQEKEQQHELQREQHHDRQPSHDASHQNNQQNQTSAAVSGDEAPSSPTRTIKRSQEMRRQVKGSKRFQLKLDTEKDQNNGEPDSRNDESGVGRARSSRFRPFPKGQSPSSPVSPQSTQQQHQSPGNHMSKEAAERIARAAAALDNQGNELFERGKFDKAMATYMKALKLKRRTFHSLLDDADDVLDEAILREEEEAGEKSAADQKLLLSMATSINNIGYLRQRAGDATPDETMKAYKKSLRIKRQILGNDSLSVGKTLNNIGSVYYLKREFDDAFEAYTEALQIMIANLGDDHPDVATVWSNMGDVLLGKRRKQDALLHYRNALNIRWTAFGEHDPKVVRLLEKIAAIEITDKMMANTPTVQRSPDGTFVYDDNDLFDLDTLPMAQELHILHEQLEEDMQFVDLMEKKMAVDMVKDKVVILRGMRELMGEHTELNESSHHSVTDHSTSDVGVSAEISPSADGRNEKRLEALKSVRARLARLREQKTTGPSLQPSGGDHVDAVDGHSSLPNLNLDPSTSNLLRTKLYNSQARLPALSTMEADELKGGVESIRSALVLKKGIDSLRSSNTIDVDTGRE